MQLAYKYWTDIGENISNSRKVEASTRTCVMLCEAILQFSKTIFF